MAAELKDAYHKPEIDLLNFWMIPLLLMLLSLPLSGAEAEAQMRPTTQTKNCTKDGCHSEVTDYAVLHGPLNAGGCAGCHRWEDTLKHTFQMTRPGSDLCLFCHKIESGTYSHQPMTEKSCLECHNPHGGETKTHLRAKTTRALCEQCHEKVVQGKLEHKPITTDGCLACHAAHSSNFPKLLRQEQKLLCLDCHVVFADKIKKSQFVHEPIGESCLQCHNTHASSRPKLLKTPMREHCFSCHEDIHSTVEQAKTQHGALAEIGECMNCHDAHATGYPHLLRNITRTLCLECHNKEIETSSRKIPDMSKVLAAGMNLHGPITINDCTECHQIHGGTRTRLLYQEYPSSFYTSFQEERYALCFSCHEPLLALASHTTETCTSYMSTRRQRAGHVVPVTRYMQSTGKITSGIPCHSATGVSLPDTSRAVPVDPVHRAVTRNIPMID